MQRLIISLLVVVMHAAAEEGYRVTELPTPTSGKAFLTRLAPSNTGIQFSNFVSEAKQLENSLLADGAGVATGDVDGDGWCDLYLAGAEQRNALFRNLGNWKFTNVTTGSGLESASQFSTGVALEDIDGDRDLDLVLNNLGGGTQLFFNDGKGRFQESTNSGLVRKFGSTSLALADIDGNGTLDLYVANYSTTKIEDRPNARFDTQTIDGKIVITAIDGVPMTSPELTNRYVVDAANVVRERGEPDILYLNDGRGKFKAQSWTDGTFLDEQGKRLEFPEYDFGLSVMFRDMNGDLAPDIYVCNDLFPPDRIWVNDGRGKFRAMSNLAVRNTCRFSMGVDFADLDHDGFDEFFVVDMLSRSHLFRKVQTSGVLPVFLPIGEIDNRPQYKRNTLFHNRGDGTYAEIAQYAGLEATEWSWMPLFLDVDMDGFEDVLVTTGHMRDSLHFDAVEEIMRHRGRRRLPDAEHRALKKKFYPVLRTPLQAFRNRGDLTFQDTARDWGFDYVGITQSMCLADLDNDGDQDVVVVPLNDATLIYRTESSSPRVAVRLKGKAPNTRGIGALIKLFDGAVPMQRQEMLSGGRYLGADDAVRVFAAGQSKAMRIEVTWRNGSVSIVSNVQPNRLYEIQELGAPRSGRVPTGGTPGPIFADVSQFLNHKHSEAFFPDFDRQPLLGRSLSQLGPGVTWADIDKDGWDDLLIGSGRGGQVAVFRNDGKGALKPFTDAPFGDPVPRDTTSLLPWPKASGLAVLVGSSNYEDGMPRGSCVREYDLAKKTVEDRLPPWECSTGPLALADWTGDGVLDLFVGGRALPGKYPEEAFSLLLRGTGDKFEVDHAGTKQITSAGLVSGAVFSDLDTDGSPELVLACEWGPLRVFRFVSGKWQEATRELGLEKFVGWWNSVTTGDFDGDGRLDIVAGNWGRNTKYQSFRGQPARIAYADFDGNGTVEALEAYYDPDTRKWAPWCSPAVAMQAMPWLQDRFKTHHAFGLASIGDILAERVKLARLLEATWLESTVFLNRGQTFEARALPREAQFSPAFGVSVADMEGDGDEDIFLSQNFFAVDGDTSRYDAGRGLWLAGDGKGNFRAVPAQESGIAIYGEQRGCAVSDFDGDGRVDLAVAQSGAETKLYRNTKANPGVRIRSAIGAVLRIDNGPAREVHAGSGYWSHDSMVQIMKPGVQLTVRWPGGKTTTTKIPDGAREITAENPR